MTLMGIWGTYESQTATNQWHQDPRLIVPPPWSPDYVAGMMSVPFHYCTVTVNWNHENAQSLNAFIPLVAKYRKVFVRLYWNDETATLTLAEALARVDWIMSYVSPATRALVEAFIIGEDDRPSTAGVIQRTNDIYDHLKALYPNSKFYAQYSGPWEQLNYQPSMKGDGFWIYNYAVEDYKFRTFAQTYVATGKPVISDLYYCADGFENGNLAYAWNFTAGQLAVCKDLGVIPFVFAFGGDLNPASGRYWASPYSQDAQAINRWAIASAESTPPPPPTPTASLLDLALGLSPVILISGVVLASECIGRQGM